MRTLLYYYFLWKYGVRGALRPPTGLYLVHTASFWKIFQYAAAWFCWAVEEKLYHYSGLPVVWEEQPQIYLHPI